jgi:hypothetical protein
VAISRHLPGSLYQLVLTERIEDFTVEVIPSNS